MNYKIYYQQNKVIKNTILNAPSKQLLYDNPKIPKNIISIKKLGIDITYNDKTNSMDINPTTSLGTTQTSNKLLTKLFNKKVNNNNIIDLFYQIQTMLEAHLSINDALGLLNNSKQKDNTIQNIIINMHKTLQDGKPIYTALEPFEHQIGITPILFLKLSIYDIKIKDCISSLVVVLRQNQKSKDKIIKALSYSFVLFVSIIACMVIIIIFVLPNFESIFSQLQGDLPLPTKILLYIRDFIEFYYPLILASLMAIFLTTWFVSIKYTLATHKFIATKLGLISKLIKIFLVYRLFLSISVMLKAKYSFQDSLKQANLTTTNKFIYNEIDQIFMSIKKGVNVDTAFKNSQINDDITCKLLTIAQTTGYWERCLSDLVKIYKNKLNKQINFLSSVIEPTFILLLAGIILWLVLGVMLPMWSLGENLM